MDYTNIKAEIAALLIDPEHLQKVGIQAFASKIMELMQELQRGLRSVDPNLRLKAIQDLMGLRDTIQSARVFFAQKLQSAGSPSQPKGEENPQFKAAMDDLKNFAKDQLGINIADSTQEPKKLSKRLNRAKVMA